MKKSWRGIGGGLLAAVLLMTLAAGCSGDGNTASGTSPTPSERTPAQTETVPAQTESAGEETRTVVDLAGREVTIPANVTKVAALTRPTYETIIMLGGVDQVAMTASPFYEWTYVVCPEYADIPVCDSPTEPNIEELIDLGIEVVLFWDTYPEVIEALEEAGIAVVVTQVGDDGISTPEEFVEMKKYEITMLAEVLGGDCIDKAARWCDYVDQVVDTVTSRTAALTDEERPTVYYVSGNGSTSLRTHAGESYTSYMVTMAGGNLVSREIAEMMYSPTMEEVMNWNPEHVFMGQVDNAELITEDPAWSAVQAVKDGNVHVNLSGLFNADYSTDCFLLMEQIAKTLHPELFEDLDLTEETIDYYQNFYGYELSAEEAEQILAHLPPA